MIKGIHKLILFFAFFCAMVSFAQNETGIATIKLDTPRIRIGEQIKLHISFAYDKSKFSKKIQWPEIDDTLRKEIEVIEKTEPKAIAGKSGTTELRQQLVITSFDSGVWVIPPFRFYLEGDTVPVAESNALVLEVNTVPTDTAESSVKDIKPIFGEQKDWRAYLPAIYWTVGILAAIGVIILIYIYMMRKKREKVFIPKAPSEPPHITALRNLEQIREQRIWREGKVKEYYTAITDTLRIYIEGRYKVPAMELTTDEILQVMRSQVIDLESKNRLTQILQLADFVKFAKVNPIETENELTLDNAFGFVNGTKREEPEPKEPEEKTEEKK